MLNPIATYRIQFHKGFTLSDLERILPYLHRLGVTTIYASPIFEAVPGSMHGYDGVNPLRINPEIGTREQLKALSKKLRSLGINWLQDIVPNHMAYHSNNVWLMDVLEKGQQSVYATFFDVGWTNPMFKGQLMAPFLGGTLEEVIEKGELKVAFGDNRLVLQYYDSAFPLKPRSYATVLEEAQQGSEAVRQLLEQLQSLYQVEEPKAYTKQWEEFRLQLSALMNHDVTRHALDKTLEAINADPARLATIASEQVYRLCHWQETDHRINYRRFFTVNGLICLNVQNRQVFDHYHKFIRSLLQDGVFQGLRVDHIDGLYQPTDYLNNLRDLAGEDTYIIVEKILELHENLPDYWPVQGSTGYDFLALVNNLFTHKKSESIFTRFYQHLVHDKKTLRQHIHDKKEHILEHHMGGELDNLVQHFFELNLIERRALASIHPEDFKTAVGEFLVQCPVYRYYGSSFPLQQEEAAAVQEIIHRMRRAGIATPSSIDILERVLLHKPHEGNWDYNGRVAQFYQRCMQFTGPLMAKGMEDTLMYTYNRFIGHNEVGDSPESFGLTSEEFHQKMAVRQQHWPYALNATSTHDTKRGEDSRARLNVLTELPDEWLAAVQQWQALNAEIKNAGAPDPNDEYFIYQALVGGYPMAVEEDDFGQRLETYLQKALREAKRHSNWSSPNNAYEGATTTFIRRLLDRDRPFLKSFEVFFEKMADFGIINALVQLILKATCPGTADIYQGCETWDLSFVDPDNRRPVNHNLLLQKLESLEKEFAGDDEALFRQLWSDRFSGTIKLWLTHRLLQLRRQRPEVFTKGDYVPLEVKGAYKEHVLAFARKYRRTVFVLVVPLRLALLCKEQGTKLFAIDWKDTHIALPSDLALDWQPALAAAGGQKTTRFVVQELFASLPFALLQGQLTPNVRGAGILMHLTSLPSLYGLGDMGPEARRFADFLYRSRQQYWQLLPLNPTEAGQGHSPYSSTSSRAGNPLLISPELLAKDGLLDARELPKYHLPRESRINYPEAERVKMELFQKAYSAFIRRKRSPLHRQFEAFVRREASWLDDFALYMLLKEHHGQRPWFEWPGEYKLRHPEALQRLTREYGGDLEKIKWLQFIFSQQWHSLKDYCNSREVQLFGDLPFYVSYDSVDVWAHRDIFALDEEGRTTGMAGVPPDAFSEDGQLWGMPVFRWDVLRERNYDWWVERFRRNAELFDLVRLDHFRAFAAYWEVPAGEQTARNGEWKEGPGAHFFQSISEQLGNLPFVAEDLGDINDEVFALRDDFGMPGMKVLQFAFGEDLPRSYYIPHNYTPNFVVYTGTHDNNTTRGWYRQEAGDKVRRRLEQYLGRGVSEEEAPLLLARLAYSSVANIVILPVQDILALDESSRLNRPASGENNWLWRLVPGQLTGTAENLLKEWTWLYNRM